MPLVVGLMASGVFIPLLRVQSRPFNNIEGFVWLGAGLELNNGNYRTFINGVFINVIHHVVEYHERKNDHDNAYY